MEAAGGGGRRRQPGVKVDTPNLRDFLRVRDENDGRSLAGLTLSAVLSERIPSPAQGKTLFEIIRDDPNGVKDSKKSWNIFRDKLRLRRAGAAWTSSFQIPASDIPIRAVNRLISRRNSITVRTNDADSENPSSSTVTETRPELNSTPLRSNSSRIASNSEPPTTAETNGAVPAEEVSEGGGEAPARMSLMALLAETDREMGLDGSTTYIMDGYDEEDEEEEEEEVKEMVGVGYNNCCVCMVRHKGSAFIPCGHTFCRLCSRELWVQRGNCPLCNGFILEILDIF